MSLKYKFNPLSANEIRKMAGITKKDTIAIKAARGAVMKPVSKKQKKTKKQLTPNVDLMLEGAVYVVEYDKQGKIVSKVELDGKAVLKALLYVLNQASKAKIKKP